MRQRDARAGRIASAAGHPGVGERRGPGTPRRLEALVYVQHLLGVGHLVRAGRLARALESEGIGVTLVSGGMPVPVFEPGVSRFEQLPPARAQDDSFKVLLDARGRPVDERWRSRRLARLLEVFESRRPDILLVEMYPFGRRQMRFEIEPLLERAAESRGRTGRPVIAASVRDILVEPRDPERVDAMVERARRHFDLVLVHGDPRLVGFEATFPRFADIADLVRYTGYVAAPAAAPSGPGGPGAGEVVVSAGGGAVGEELLRAAIGARPLTRLRDAPWRVLVGHGFPEARFRACRASAPAGVRVERARTDFERLLASCALSVSQGGYNTVTEIIAARARAVCVPFAGGAESEQTLRCRLLAQRGIIELVEPDQLAPASLARAIERALDAPARGAPEIDIGGAARSAELLREKAASRPRTGA